MFTPCCSGWEPTTAKELRTAGLNPHSSHPLVIKLFMQIKGLTELYQVPCTELLKASKHPFFKDP